MTREHKLALILGFSIVLVVGVLVSDHLSGASVASLEQFADASPETTTEPLIAPGQSLREERAPATNRLAQANPPAEQPSVNGSATSNAPPQTYEQFANRGDDGVNALVDAVQRQLDRVGVGSGSAPVAGQLAPDRTTSADPAPVETPTQAAPRTPSQITAVQYVVSEGDTLWSITEDYYGEPLLHERVRAFNSARISESAGLRIGDTIYLPDPKMINSLSLAELADSGASPKAATTAKPSNASTVADASDRTYTVQKGDTLGEISMKLLGTSKRWREIVDLNADRINNPDRVPAGVVLRIPTS